MKSAVATGWKFTRPHTIRGTLLACICGTLRALMDHHEYVADAWTAGLFWPTVARAAAGFAGLLLGNVFIVGINQIYDVSVDRVNKPYLPMASGELGVAAAWAVCLAAAAAGLAVVYTVFGGILFPLYALALALGAAYSVPPLQLKRYPLAACAIIALARGALANFGVYYAAIGALGVPFHWSPAVLFLVGFMSVYALVIALAKDIPDIVGDRAHNIRTFAVRAGERRMLDVTVAVLVLDYGFAMILPFLAPEGSYRIFPMILSHALLLAYLLRNYSLARKSTSPASIRDFYASLWSLLYLEFFVLLII